MADREMVIKCLKAYVDCYDNRHSVCESDCALYGHGDCAKYAIKYIDEAISLLKDQEAKQVNLYRKEEWVGPVYGCPDCKAIWMVSKSKTHFCPNCGQAVRWDG